MGAGGVIVCDVKTRGGDFEAKFAGGVNDIIAREEELTFAGAGEVESVAVIVVE